MKEQRFDFSDYSAKEQEIDANRKKRQKLTDVYISKVDGIWHALISDDLDVIINGKVGEDIKRFYERLTLKMERDFKIKPRFRCIQNSGVDEYIRKNQLVIRNFKERT